jgi:hypothetical protein
MGLGAYLAAVTERDHYIAEEQREHDEVLFKPEAEKEEIFEIMEVYNIPREASRPLVESLCKDPENWVKVCCFLFPFSPFLLSSRQEREKEKVRAEMEMVMGMERG